VDLILFKAPKDLMTKFVDCLVLLSNLRALDIFGTSSIDPMKKDLKRERARFPSIRELCIGDTLGAFVDNCPNVESVTVVGGFTLDIVGLCLHAKELKRLKRVAGVPKEHVQRGEPRNTFWSEAPID